ncbi:hypothetical protein ABR737_00765 [Streptomyces sp. Edi2]|uniref:hypothetical protein n=1 Tax=Streptomyces sp. Edi2 TaxID=3162528 RepID=UPI0033066114
MSTITGIAEIAERLYHEPAASDFNRPPIPIRADITRKATPGPRTHATRDVLSILVDHIGPPTLYGGSAHGPNIRWRTDTQTLLLDHGVAGLQLSVHRTSDLERREAAVFQRGVGDGPGQEPSFSSLPYLWQLYRGGPDAVPTSLPAAPPAPDWQRLEEALASLMHAWLQQLPTQVDDDAAAFNIVNHADGDRILSVICGARDDVTLLIDDQDAPHDRHHQTMMMRRGWDAPVLGWWQAFYEPTSAASAARHVVTELRLRGARTPHDLGADQISCADEGLLVLPGLGIRP